MCIRDRFRGPSGPAVQVAAQHSQAFESFYANVPGLKVVLPSSPKDAKGLLISSIRDDNPVVFMESETLYNNTGEVPSDQGPIPIGVADIKRPGKDITLIAWSKMVDVATEAADALKEQGIEAEIVDPRTLRPLDIDTIAKSVAKTGRAVIVEVGWPNGGFGAEIAYQLQKECMDHLDSPILRVTSEDVPMPYAANLEKDVIPSPQKVIHAVKKALYLE